MLKTFGLPHPYQTVVNIALRRTALPMCDQTNIFRKLSIMYGDLREVYEDYCGLKKAKDKNRKVKELIDLHEQHIVSLSSLIPDNENDSIVINQMADDLNNSLIHFKQIKH